MPQPQTNPKHHEEETQNADSHMAARTQIKQPALSSTS